MENILSVILGRAIKILKCILSIAGKNLIRAMLSKELVKTLNTGRIKLNILFSF